MTRKRAAAGPPAAARQAETRAPPLGIADEVNLADSEELAKADSTLKTYKRFITGKRGWLEWTAGQAVPPLSLNVNAASIVAKYYFYRTEKLTLGEDLGGQLIVAISAYYDANTECGKDKWAAVVRVNETSFTSGNPANSSKVTTMKENHHKARVRAGTATPESVDVIEPLHVRAFFAANLRGRRLHECDPLAVMLHAGSMMGMSMLVRFNELTGLHTDHLGQSQVGGALHPTFSLASTKNSFQRKVYDLVPWPTSLSLDPRFDPVLAFASWMRLRGGARGWIFPAFRVIGSRLRVFPEQQASAPGFVDLLRRFYAPCGVLDPMLLATHTMKRSGCQLYKALGQSDAWLMDKGGWSDFRSYMRYLSGSNRPEQQSAFGRGRW
ncbi:hypothetical protein BU14_0093s0043 [Porphyra umbilicalis]|uniref:Tyr recombinase domain-containing protein n=2 Tax=Porphyra umbilicalis TaxID=2786 RepID=A0A1X6PDX4_PORUM|nr:hypothetical protein BU14_0093s0043 [Porphyra umbilicalis]|eukprot:OSX79000.1 hypothetical protein BU14_0093s0043 [Porphyra umbilicalis]